MKTVVLYKSKTGYVKKYAEWIAKELSADIFEASRFSTDKFAEYDTVIFGGGLYVGGINGVKYIINNHDKLRCKKIVVFATGASPNRDEVVNEVRDKNFTLEQQKHIKFFYMRGGFDYSKCKPVDKFLMILLKWKLKNKKVLTNDERGMLMAYSKPVDFSK